MSIFTIFFVLILAPLLKCVARLAGFVLVFPLVLAVMLGKTWLARKARSTRFHCGASVNR